MLWWRSWQRVAVAIGTVGLGACADYKPEVREPTAPAGSATVGDDESDDGIPLSCGNGRIEPEEDCDDGDDDPLDGCLASCRLGPVGFASGETFATPLRGNIKGGTAFDDDCPPGQALVGLEGHVGGVEASGIRGARGLCGELALVYEDDVFSVEISEEQKLPFHGTGERDLNGVTLCPADQVVVGFAGLSGPYIEGLRLLCSSLSIVDEGGTFGLKLGEPTGSEPMGGPGGEPFEEVGCGDGAVGVTTNIRAGQLVDAFGLGCGVIVLEVGG